MAISFHAAATAGSGSVAATSATCTSLVVTVGDLIIVCVATINTTITSITDTSGNTYSPFSAFLANGANVSCQLWKAYAKTSATITTITATIASSRWAMVGVSYTSVPQASGFNASATGSVSPDSVTNNIEDPLNVIVSGMSARGTGTYTAATGNLRTSVAGPGSTSPGAAIMDNTGASAGASVVTSATLSASASWVAVSGELKTVPSIDTWMEGQCQPREDYVDIVTY